MKFSRFRDSLPAMVLVALAIRLVVVGFLYPRVLTPPYHGHFPFGYEAGRIAQSLVSGKGFASPVNLQTGPTAWLPPVYPLLVAGVVSLFGMYTKASAALLLSLNGLFSALTCIPIVLLGRRSFGARVGIWAGWIWALFPHAIFLSADAMWSTCLATLLLALLLLVALRLQHTTRLSAWVGFGLLGGFAGLTTASLLATLPFLGVWLCYRLHRRGERWLLPAVSAALAAIVLAMPWTVRNYEVFHRLIPIRDGFWLEFYLGNTGDLSTYQTPWARRGPDLDPAQLAEYGRLGEIPYMAEKRRQALAFVESHPAWFLWTTLRRIVFTWTGFWELPRERVREFFDTEQAFDPASVLIYSTLTVLMLVGLRRGFLDRVADIWPYALVLLSYPLVYYITHPDLRYRHMIDPVVVILAVYAVLGSDRARARAAP
jgi:4-amino-4-deoxy-L-arabinose transferase-like glycosyltransferase